MLIRRLLMSMVVTGALVLGVAGPAGSFPTGFTVTPPNAPAGVLTATLVGDVCNLDLRLAILDQANQQLADNGTGGSGGYGCGPHRGCHHLHWVRPDLALSR